MELPRFEKQLHLPDPHIPDEDKKAVSLIFKFIPDFKPDVIFIKGDVGNLTYASRFDVIGDYPSIGDEVRAVREFLYKLTDIAKKANPHVIIIFEEGNHEQRLQKYLYREADKLTDLTDEEGQQILTVPHLYNLNKLGIKWVPFYKVKKTHKIASEHGDISRCKAGYTAHAMIDRRGCSGYSAHTHKFALVARRIGGKTIWWMECGCLSNLDNPDPRYVKKPDWVHSFGIGIYDRESGITHPIPILIQKNQFYFEGKIYQT